MRTLRRYHEASLLEPASVDPASGYRYHSSQQIPSAQVIHRLRELDMPLAKTWRTEIGWPIFRLSPNLDGCSVTELAL